MENSEKLKLSLFDQLKTTKSQIESSVKQYLDDQTDFTFEMQRYISHQQNLVEHLNLYEKSLIQFLVFNPNVGLYFY